MQDYVILGGTNFVDGLVIDQALSIDYAPTAATAIGLEPPANATGEVRKDWIKP